MCASAAADLWSGLGLFGVSMATRFLCHPIPYCNRIVKSVQIVNFQLENTGVTRDEAWSLANHWVAAWNAHDLDSIMERYEDAIELTSPVAARLLGSSDGKVVGKANLRAYFQRGLEAYPELDFRLEDVLWGVQQRCALLHKTKKGRGRQSSWSCQRVGK